MSESKPYTILHLSWDVIEETELGPGHYYLVFWLRDIPLGHYWLEVGAGGAALKEHQAAIGEVIGPVLGYYVNKTYPEETSNGGSLSVVICTRNRPDDLERGIRALLASEDKDFELIIVDNAPEDERTARVVDRFAGVRYVLEPRPGLDIARNAGARAARGGIVAYTDDDVEVSPTWTCGIKSAFADPQVMAVTGMVIPSRLETLSQYLFEKYWGFNKGYLPRDFDQAWFRSQLPFGAPVWDIGAGANMAFRKDVFLLAGWFDERLDVGAAGCSGDSEMWYRILAEGWNCRYLPQLVVYHHHRKTMAELRRQLFYYMRGHVSALLVQFERYGHPGIRKRLYRALPLYYWSRWWRWIRHRQEDTATVGIEVRGCFSGWRYYRSIKRSKPESEAAGLPDMPQGRSEEALVSVVIPCYNHGHYLGAAIESVLAQTYPHREIIVVDDGSTDSTPEVCRAYEGVRYIRSDRVGPSVARNIGVAISKGSFVNFLDADDVLYPNALELNLYYFGYYADAVFISGGYDRIDERGWPLEAPAPEDRVGGNYQALLKGNYIGMEATVLYRRELFFRYFFDPRVSACEDYDLNLRIARDWPVYGHAHKIAAYRIHGGNRSGDKAWMARMAIAVLKKQKSRIRTEEERRSYEAGLSNWKKYYHL
ncbi:MAG TPA: glycosyltransferase [Puia sp.]|nr:glycosyltransferase [Puia sp.]